MNSKRKSLRLILWGFIFLAYFTPFKLSAVSVFLLFTFKFYKDVVLSLFFVSFIEIIFVLQSPIIVENFISGYINNYILNTQMSSVPITISYFSLHLSYLTKVIFMISTIFLSGIMMIFSCIFFRFTLGKKILNRVDRAII